MGSEVVPGPDGHTTRTILIIEGMTCASCTTSISSALLSHPLIIQAKVDLLSSSVVVQHRPALAPSVIEQVIEDTGFGAQVVSSAGEASPGGDRLRKRTILALRDTVDASSALEIESSTRALEGLEAITIDLPSQRVVVDHLDSLRSSAVLQAVLDAGHRAEVILTESTSDRRSASDTRTVLIRVTGMSSAACPTKLNACLAALPLSSHTKFSTGVADVTVVYQPAQVGIRSIIDSLSSTEPELEAHVVKSQSLSERGQRAQRREARLLYWHFGVAFMFTVPTFVIAIIGMIILSESNSTRQALMMPIWGAANLGTVILWPLASVVQFGVGSLFYIRGTASFWPHLRRFRPNSSRPPPPLRLTWRNLFTFGSMDLLVILSTTTAYSASLAMLILDVLAPPETGSVGTYFDTSVFLIMFILAGRCMEGYAKSRTMDAVGLLGSLRPETALLIDPAGPTVSTQDSKVLQSGFGATTSIPIDHLELGDHVLVPPGSLPPADGVILFGDTTFDESSLTGESKAISKGPGDEVFTGTTNKTGAIVVKVTGVDQNTMLEKIVAAVSGATARKAPIEMMAERLTGVFVPIVIYLTLIVTATWLAMALTGRLGLAGQGRTGGQVFFALEFAIATLVIACPCGIGLAVPCATAVGNGIAAKAGILAAGGGEAFLGAARAGVVAVDKTGTLTLGSCQVRDEQWVKGSIEREVLTRSISAVEALSTHPLAVGLVQHLGIATDINVIRPQEISGRGLLATCQHGAYSLDILIGNIPLLLDYGVVLSAQHAVLLQTWQGEAKSTVLVAVRSSGSESFTLAALYSLSDAPRPDAARVIADLKQQGNIVVMVTGDNEVTAKALAKEIGIETSHVYAGIGPEEKAKVIINLQKPRRIGHRFKVVQRWREWRNGSQDMKQLVVFLGDGINDSVALAAADVSIAMGHGAQSTLASADFVLLNSSLSSLPTLLRISRKVYNRQRLNLAWAVAFNIVCLPFAAGVFYPAGGIKLNPVWAAVLMACSSVSVVASSLALRWSV